MTINWRSVLSNFPSTYSTVFVSLLILEFWEHVVGNL